MGRRKNSRGGAPGNDLQNPNPTNANDQQQSAQKQQQKQQNQPQKPQNQQQPKPKQKPKITPPPKRMPKSSIPPPPPPPYDEELNDHYYHVNQLLDRPGPMTDPSFEAGATVPVLVLTTHYFIRTTCKVLVIGAGGLGCDTISSKRWVVTEFTGEILQNLALLGFADIHVIDMDTIDISNLNRQFLFRLVFNPGSTLFPTAPKAEVAAKFIMQRVPQLTEIHAYINRHYCKIQDKDDAFYMMFNLVICGLDSVQARQNPESLKPLIDGGTEGKPPIQPLKSFKGQSRVILPTITSCYECSLDMLTPQTVYPICTIANTPRLPEHCIEWASVLEWPRVFKDKKLDTDNPDHIQWLYEQATARANQHKISGITWSLTQGVVKNIIPAIASTNAIIAGKSNPFLVHQKNEGTALIACMLLLLLTNGHVQRAAVTKRSRSRRRVRLISKTICEYIYIYIYISQTCIPKTATRFNGTDEMVRFWLVVGCTTGPSRFIPIPSSMKRNLTVQSAAANPFCLPYPRIGSCNKTKLTRCMGPESQIKQPSLSTSKGPLFFQGPPELRRATEANLDKTLGELFPDHQTSPETKEGIEITVTDSSLPFQLGLRVQLQ
ncbi:uncharacterized protein VP01_282g7 [Puccinia sorghi]|uniref:NEDD8-activating enzyme E1 catalytic subunit n=1 Tax=Puccinia sorghi TaxID=27349 RepID=A0A0L6V284_9BASI|nr:uncharacterized protein VP01_282g7 [Puccinia sorghi]